MVHQRNSLTVKFKLFRILGLIIFLLLLSSAAMVLFCKMEDSVEGRGVVAGMREHILKSRVNSNISSLHARSGDIVKKGDVLLKLDDRDFQENLLKLKNRIAELEAKITMTKIELEVIKADPLPKEYRHSKISLKEYQDREKRELESITAYRKLYESKAMSLVEFQRKEIDYLKTRGEMERFAQDVRLIEEGFSQKIIAQKTAELEFLVVQLDNLRRESEFYDKHKADFVFIAPEDGTISNMPTKTGIYVEPGETLITLASSGPKKFIAYINEKDIYKVQENQRVKISSSQYNYFEYGYFYGTVYAIDELPQQHGLLNCYAVRIKMDDSKKVLRLGSTGGAEILTGKNFIFKIIFKL